MLLPNLEKNSITDISEKPETTQVLRHGLSKQKILRNNT